MKNSRFRILRRRFGLVFVNWGEFIAAIEKDGRLCSGWAVRRIYDPFSGLWHELSGVCPVEPDWVKKLGLRKGGD